MKTLKFALLIALSSLSAWSCNETSLEENTTQESFTGVQALAIAQPNLSAAPPIAQDFIIQQLGKADLAGNNLLFKAVFKRDEPRLANISSFQVQVLEGLQVVLHDDGINGDEFAGDRIFSSFVKEDILRLTEMLKAKNVLLERNNRMITQFSGRAMETTQSAMIDLTSFAAKRPTTLGGGVATVNVTLPVFNQLKGNSLMITDIGVVQDPTRTFNPCFGSTSGNPNGVWTFKSLMTKMANTGSTGVSVDSFVKGWVNTELFGQKTQASSGDITTITDFGGPLIRDNLLTSGSKKTFISAWLKNSGITVNQTNINNWQTLLTNKLEFFPVRLLAIVNRLDLRGNFGYSGNTNSGGEGRFVFCFMDSNCSSNQKMTIIFEYGIPITESCALKNYAQQWYNLKNFTLNGTVNTGYNAALEAITNVFTNAGAGGTKPNGNALNHLRSNEFLMSPWNIRDFSINASSHKLELIHPDKEPMSEANANSVFNLGAKINSLVAFANANATIIEAEGAYSIPSDIKAIDGQIPSPSPTPPYFWNGQGTSIISDLARHKLSLNTCSGCHANETKTGFTHVIPANFGTPAALSSFLTGLGNDDETADIDSDPIGAFWIKDRANRPTAATATKRGFNDLFRRANHLEALVNIGCGGSGTVFGLADVLRFQPTNTTD
jgi:hypothetical protein